VLQCLHSRCRVIVRIQSAEEYLCDAEIAAYLDLIDTHVLQTRIFDLGPQELAEQLMQFSCYAEIAAVCTCHGLDGARNFSALITLDLIAGLDVVVVLDADTAFSSGPNFVDVILEASQ
jgi:hypothetical protein